MLEPIDLHRRRLLGGTSALTGMAFLSTSAVAQTSSQAQTAATSRSDSNSTFASIHQVSTSALSIGYAEMGPAAGPAVILLHGWPHDIHSFIDVAPLLAERGYRVLVPYLRGYGSTRILAADTLRNGQQSVFAADLIDFMDALRIDSAVLAGFDWGGRAANIVAAAWPNRCRALVCASGYLIGSQEANRKPLPPQAEFQAWFLYYFATERGAAGYRQYRDEFNRLVWQNASPRFAFDEATFQRTARSFDNPDHDAVVIHNYRWRLALAQGEARLDELERMLATRPKITVPTITLEGDANGAPHLPPAAYAALFTGKYLHRNLTGGIGHNLPQEAPAAFANAVVEATKL